MRKPAVLTFIVLLSSMAASVGRPAAQPWPDRSSPAPARLPLVFDMRIGHESAEVITCGSGTRDTAFAWCDGLVRDQCCRGPKEPSEYVEGQDGTFVVAVDPPDVLCRLRITLGDPLRSRGPVRILINDRPAVGAVSTAPGEFRTIEVDRRARLGRIAVRFRAEGCGSFAVRAVEVSAFGAATLGRLFPAALPRDPVPPPETLRRVSAGSCQSTLRAMSEFLLLRSPRQGGFSYHGAWYENAYPVRTLLAASRILGERRYGERAFGCLDAFVKCQDPGGNWLSNYFAPPECGAVRADSASSNLADIATMTTCLALAAPLASASRQAGYLEAARKYADNISLPAQLADGAFPNGHWGGEDFAHPYTTATATQSSSLAALFDATGDSRYIQAAERAAWWLVRNTFRADGKVSLHPHNRADTVVASPLCFGDMFYVADALIQVRRSTADDSLRAAIDASLEHWLRGPGGLASLAVHGYWWKPQEEWSNSKMAGMLFVLANHPRLRQDLQIRQWLDNALAWMADPECAAQLGVMVHPAGPGGAYALAATGFAGIGVAAALDPAALVATPVPVALRIGH